MQYFRAQQNEKKKKKKAFTTEVSMTFPSLEITTLNIPDIFRFL